jgi:hypothetical protein
VSPQGNRRANRRLRYAPWIVPGRTPADQDDFDRMTRRKAESFVAEFIKRIPERIEQLSNFVASTRGFGSWRPAYSKSSLRPLGRWILRVVSRRPLRPEDGYPRILNPLPKGVTLRDLPVMGDEPTFTDDSFSPLVDVGIYIGECLRRKNPRWHWRRCGGGRANLRYNQPMLAYAEESEDGFTPFSIPFNAVAQMMEGEIGEDGLVQLLVTWRESYES